MHVGISRSKALGHKQQAAVTLNSSLLLTKLQAKSPDGSTVKFLVLNVHTMDELKLTVNPSLVCVYHLAGQEP
jgi:hypothetical protein